MQSAVGKIGSRRTRTPPPRQETQQKGCATQSRVAQEGAKRTAARQQRPEQRHKQQSIAHIGEENAPRVVVKAEHTSLSVGVVGGLIDAPAVNFCDMVHRHHIILPLHTQTTLIVRRRLRARIVMHRELRELYVKRQATHVVVVGQKEMCRFAHAQMQTPIDRTESGAQGADQNHHKRGVQREGMQSVPQATAFDHPRPGDHNGRPQQTEAHRGVESGVGSCTSPHVLGDGGCNEHHHLHRKEEEREFRKDGRFHCGDRLRRCTPSR